MIRFGGMAFVLWFVCASCCADELDEQKRLASKYDAKIGVRLSDGSYVDFLTDTHAIEIDYPRKWAEGVGQSLHYALVTGKKPGLILLLSDPETEWQELVRAARLCGKYDIDLWIERSSKEDER